MIDIDESIFLGTFEKFTRHLLPLYNRERKEEGMLPMTPDEAVNLFLELRKKYNMTKDASTDTR